MGESKRRKEILGDSYGRQKEFSIRSYDTYTLELAECVSSHSKGIVGITAQVREVGVIDGGLVVPFVIEIKTGGRIMGLAYPSVGSPRSETEIIVGLAVTDIVEIQERQGSDFFNSIKSDVILKISLAFREWVHKRGYLSMVIEQAEAQADNLS